MFSSSLYSQMIWPFIYVRQQIKLFGFISTYKLCHLDVWQLIQCIWIFFHNQQYSEIKGQPLKSCLSYLFAQNKHTQRLKIITIYFSRQHVGWALLGDSSLQGVDWHWRPLRALLGLNLKGGHTHYHQLVLAVAWSTLLLLTVASLCGLVWTCMAATLQED